MVAGEALRVSVPLHNPMAVVLHISRLRVACQHEAAPGSADPPDAVVQVLRRALLLSVIWTWVLVCFRLPDGMGLQRWPGTGDADCQAGAAHCPTDITWDRMHMTGCRQLQNCHHVSHHPVWHASTPNTAKYSSSEPTDSPSGGCLLHAWAHTHLTLHRTAQHHCSPAVHHRWRRWSLYCGPGRAVQWTWPSGPYDRALSPCRAWRGCCRAPHTPSGPSLPPGKARQLACCCRNMAQALVV